MIFNIMTICILLIPCPNGYADSTADIVDRGNSAYLSGKYDDAISAYDEAAVDAPESPHIYFNKGAAFYQKGDYASASQAFEKSALKSKDIALEAKSKFNLGNCAYREAERQQDSDLNKALEACAKSIRHYQEALELDPDFDEAAENIEVVRLVMKTILDEINKQKEAQKQQQEAMQQTAEKLKELIKRQQDALDRNTRIDDERSKKGDSQKLKEQTQDLAQDQRNLHHETRELAENMPKPGSQNAQATETPEEKHLKNAAKEQMAASGNLEQDHNSEAKVNQKKALKELKNALESLGKGQSGRGQKDNKQQEGEQQGEQQAPSGEQPPQDKEDQENDQAAAAQLSDDAHDILDEEKDNKKQRRMQAAGGYRDVDKDW
jgi:Ca-activated chloride channel family protein